MKWADRAKRTSGPCCTLSSEKEEKEMGASAKKKFMSIAKGAVAYALLLSLVACSSSKPASSGSASSAAPAVASTADASAEEAARKAEEEKKAEEERKAAEEEAKRKAEEEEAARKAAEEEAARQAEEERNMQVVDVDYMRGQIEEMSEELGYYIGDEGRSEIDGAYLFWLYPTNDDDEHLATLVALCDQKDYRNYINCAVWLDFDFGENRRDVFTLEELRGYLEKYALFDDDRMRSWRENEASPSELNDQLIDAEYMTSLVANRAKELGFTSVDTDVTAEGDPIIWVYAPDNDYGLTRVRVRMHSGPDNSHSATNNYCEMSAWFNEESSIWYVRDTFTPQDVLVYLEDYSAVFSK